MATLFSTCLQNKLAVTGSLLAQLNNCKVDIYSGTVPASADAAISGGSVLLVSIDNAGTPGTFNSTASDGVLVKTSSESWSGTCAATGTATFFRCYVPGGGDTGATADTSFIYSRVQGAVGVDMASEMILPSVSLTSGNTQALSTFQIQL
jgi:hypothetical protein